MPNNGKFITVLTFAILFPKFKTLGKINRLTFIHLEENDDYIVKF